MCSSGFGCVSARGTQSNCLIPILPLTLDQSLGRGAACEDNALLIERFRTVLIEAFYDCDVIVDNPKPTLIASD